MAFSEVAVTEMAELLSAWQAGSGLPVAGQPGALERQDYLQSRARIAGDHFAHAAGRICQKCDRLIEAMQPARRGGKSEAGWVHDVCPG
jgi:hypothetical protein